MVMKQLKYIHNILIEANIVKQGDFVIDENNKTIGSGKEVLRQFAGSLSSNNNKRKEDFKVTQD